MSGDLKRPTFAGMSVCLLPHLLQRIGKPPDAGPKMSNNTVMSGDSKRCQTNPMSVGLLLCLLRKIEREGEMFFFCSFATQTGISGILDFIKPRRGVSAFLALSLQYASKIPKQIERVQMWRA